MRSLRNGRLGPVVAGLMLVTGLAAGCTAADTQPSQPGVGATGTHPAAARLLRAVTPQGRITLDVSGLSDRSVRQNVSDVARRSLTDLTAIYGRPWHDLRIQIQISPALTSSDAEGQFVVTDKDCAARPVTARILLVSGDSVTVEAGLPHELAHALHGCAEESGPQAEALAEAGNRLLHEREPHWPHTVPFSAEQYGQLNRPGIGVPRGPGFLDLKALQNFRYQMLSAAFTFYEHAHPGFLRRLYAQLYQEVRRSELTTGQLAQASLLDYFATAQRLDPTFRSWYRHQHIFDPEPQGNQLLVLATAYNVRVVAIKRNQWGSEEPWTDLPVTVRVPGGGSASCRTNRKGSCWDASYDLQLSTLIDWRGHQEVTVAGRGGGLTDSTTIHLS